MSFVPKVSGGLAFSLLCNILSPSDVAGFAPPPLSSPVRRSLMHAEARPGKFVKDFGGPMNLPTNNQSSPPNQEKDELYHLLSKDFKDTSAGDETVEWFDITTKHGEDPITDANDASPGLRHGRDSSTPKVDPLARIMVGFTKAGLSQVTHAALLISLTLATVFAPPSPASALDSGGRMGGAFVGGTSGARQSITRSYSTSYSSSRSYVAPSSSYYNRGGYGSGSGSFYGSPRYYRAAPRPYYNGYSPYYGGAGSGYYYGSAPLALGPPRSYVAPSPYAVAPAGGVVTVATSTPSVFDAFAIGAFLFFFTSL